MGSDDEPKMTSMRMTMDPATGWQNNGFILDEKTKSRSQSQSTTPAASALDLSTAVVGGAPPPPPGEDRQEWANPTEFLLSCISMSVGIGNFYRFPFTAYENGGGAFLIPYLIVLFFIGKPIYFMELALGQFCSYGQVKCWNVSPIFKGVGYGSVLGSFAVTSYYCSIMALTVFYFFASFQKTLPWTVCNPDWLGQEFCDEATENGTSSSSWGRLPRLNTVDLDLEDEDVNKTERLSFAQLYFERDVLKQVDNIDDGIGVPEWRLSLCLLFSWLAVFFSLVRGVKSSGKVAYFTAIYPYIVLLTLLIHGLVKEGSIEGIKYFITPQWDKIVEPKVWFAAVSQCFFSLSTGFGPIIMYASYNPFRHNVYRDAMIVSLMDTFTSLLAGLTVFAILGNLAADLGVDVSVVAKSGPGLIFVSYADAISKFDFVPQLFAVLFFIMLFALGVGSAVSWQMAVITVICDQFPKLSKFWVTALSCVACFLVGLIYVTPGGQWMLQLVDFFAGNFTIYVLATLEVVGIVWVYGLANFCQDIEFMLNMKISWFWKFTWGLFVPIVLMGVLLYSLIKFEPVKYNGQDFPSIAIACGWTLAAICLLFVPICGVHAIQTRKSEGLRDKFVEATRPTLRWGPKDPKTKEEWAAIKRKRPVYLF